MNRTTLLGLALLLASAPRLAAARPVTSSVANLVIGVADFSGADKQVGKFIADTLLTDLARSETLQLVERDQIGRALTELKLQSTGLTEPGAVQRVGRLVGANRLVVGSYLSAGGSMMINARLLDVSTGRLTPGGAANVEGSASDMLNLVDRLANLFHLRITGHHLPPQSRAAEGAQSADDSLGQNAGAAVTSYAPVAVPTLRRAPLPDGRSPITAGELKSALAATTGRGALLSGVPAGAHLSRLRALVAVAHALFPVRDISSAQLAHFARMVPDIALAPIWTHPALGMAVAHGLWPAHQPLNPRRVASRRFVEGLISRAPNSSYTAPDDAQQAAADTSPQPQAPERSPQGEGWSGSGYTGLAVDARDLPVQRSMSLRVLDEDGRIIYPDPDHEPDPDFVDDSGTADYHHSTNRLNRAGSSPLVVQAIGVSGDDVVITRDDADRILRENERSHFLWHWRVCVVVDEGR